ncbi:unnamed protein product [Gongylonema pulchrum]|uniref:CA domain-containing protein n=1 Tax=Gongylonema pulchrum TaxID=637853 RepID=A0A183CV88_9BILA|nr:unnamed protein product [Gongylonema pulchrum]
MYKIKVRAEDQGISRVLASERDIQLRLKRAKMEWAFQEPQFLSANYIGFVNEEDAPLTYSIVSGNIDAAFAIDNDGRITTAQELDYEIENSYHLKVIGTGSYKNTAETDVTDGENTSRATLLVKVEDVNDCVPKFEDEFYMVAAPKGTKIGTTVTKLRALDLDSGAAGKVQYALVNGSSSGSKFKIDSETGDLSLAANLEDRSVHYLKVYAFDRGKPSLGSAVVVRVAIGETEKRKPIRFAKKSYSFEVPENAFPHITFGKVSLLDSVPSDVTLRIQDSETDNFFGIMRDGSLYLKQQIDNEFKSEYLFVVEAVSPHATFNASVKVHVKVLDINDNSPYFTDKINELTISEHLNSIISLDFTATDEDSGDDGRITYQILSGNDYGMFGLNSSSGVLYFEGALEDGEQQQLLNGTLDDLIIGARDGGARWNCTRVHVRFDPEWWSATAPLFIVSQYEVNVFEDTPIGSTILGSTAVSGLGVPGEDWIYALNNNDEVLFYLNENNDACSMSFTAQNPKGFASGAGHQFGPNSESFKIPRNSQVGQRIGVVSATDQDAGSDGEIKYEMEGNATRYLSIDPNTGQIFGDFSSLDMFTTTGTLSETQILTLASLILLFILLITLVILVINMRLRNRTKPKKQVYSVSRGNVAVVSNMNRRTPDLEQEKQLVFPLQASPTSRFKVLHIHNIIS